MQVENFSASPDALLSLIEQVKLGYKAPSETIKKRGRPPDFSDRAFLLLAVVAVVTKTFSDSELHRLLKQDKPLRASLGFVRVPHRTCILRRLKALLPSAEEQVSLFGKQILQSIKIAPKYSEVSATDGRMYSSIGPLWHKRDRQQNHIPPALRNVDRESSWSRSHYRGWVQGYRLILQTLCFPEPVPLFAVWRENSRSEAECLATELEAGLLQVTDVMLGDTRLAELDLPEKYAAKGGWLLSPKHLPGKNRTWKHDLYEYRRETMELLFQRLIQAFDLKECKVKGKTKNGVFILASVWVYQICFLKNYRENKPLAIIKEQIENARWRLK
jgi:hypothetical protein